MRISWQTSWSITKKGLPIMKNVLQSLAKSVLIPLGLTAASSVVDAGTHKKRLRSGSTALIILNEETEDIIKIFKSLEDSGLLIKGVTEIIQNEAKGQKGGFLSMLLCTFNASSLRNMIAGKGIKGARDGIIRAGYKSLKNKNF